MFIFYEKVNMGEVNPVALVNRIEKKISETGKIKSIYALGKVCGISDQTILNWRYKGSSPTIDKLSKIAAVLEVSLDWLVYGEDNISKISSEEHQELCRLYDAAEDDARHYALVILRDSAERKKGFPQRACAGQDGR